MRRPMELQEQAQPLLPSDKTTAETEEGKRIPEHSETKSRWRPFVQEGKMTVKLAFPILVCNVLVYFIQVTTTVITGRLPQKEFDAVCLSLSFINIYGLVLSTGACTACDTLFSQSMGSVDKRRTGLWLQKSLLVLNCGGFIVAAVHANSEPLFLLLGQDPEVSRLAASYSLVMLPAIFFFLNFVVFLRFLQNINCVYVPILMLVIANVANITIQYVSIFIFNAGYLAAAVSSSISYGLLLVMAIAYILIFRKYEGVWDGFKREALSEWGQLALLALSGIGHYALEDFCRHAAALLAGSIDAVLMSTQTIILQFESWLYMIPAAFSVAINIRVGQALGRGDAAAAQRCLKSSLVLAVILALSFSAVILAIKNQIPWFFTVHSVIANQVSLLLPIMILVIAMDCFRCILDGAMRGCGRQLLGAFFMFLSFYCVGLPIGVPLIFLTTLRLIGFWMGICAALVLSMALTSFVLYRQDWEKEAVKAQCRVLSATKPTSKTSKDEKSPLLPRNVAEIRTPREPRSCSTTFELMREHRHIPPAEFRRLLIRRGFMCAACVLLFVGSIVTNFLLPPSLYRPDLGNYTVINGSHFEMTAGFDLAT